MLEYIDFKACSGNKLHIPIMAYTCHEISILKGSVIFEISIVEKPVVSFDAFSLVIFQAFDDKLIDRIVFFCKIHDSNNKSD